VDLRAPMVLSARLIFSVIQVVRNGDAQIGQGI
jgi:hypothetical protein